jgi:hypothetical protein
METDLMRKLSKEMRGGRAFEEMNEMDDDMNEGGRGDSQVVFIDEKTMTFDDLKFNDDLDSDADEK